MTSAAPITVHVRWIPSGCFWLRGERSGVAVDATELRFALFAWHEPSGYGTFVDTIEIDRREGILLPADEALSYFARPSWNEYVRFAWDETGTRLLDAGPDVLLAWERDRIVPDFELWKQGRRGWKFAGDGRLDGIHALGDSVADGAASARFSEPDQRDREENGTFGDPAELAIHAWIDHLMAERLDRDSIRLLPPAKEDGPAAASGAETAGARSRASGLTAEASEGPVWPPELFDNETDWLIALGWMTDPAPFRTCLQLIEPDFGSVWTLQIVLQDRSDSERLVRCGPDGTPAEPMPEGWSGHTQRIRAAMDKWFHLVPWLRSAGTDDIRTFLEYTEAWDFLMDKSIRLAELGLPVLLPAWWDRLRRMKPRLRAKMRSTAASDSMFGLNQIMQFDWRVALGGLELSEEEFRELSETNRPLARIQGQWVLLDPALLEQVQRMMKQVERRKGKGLTFREVLELHLLGGETIADDGDDADPSLRLRMEVELNESLRGLIGQLQQTDSIPPLAAPSTFRGELRRYQTEGSSWLLFLRRFGLGGCLADDMGLGKTIQYITYLLHVKASERPNAPSLLICPTSVLGNWQKELERFAPSLRVRLHYGPNRSKGDAFAASLEGCDLLITSYALANLDQDELQGPEWSSVCLDEAQNIKNAYTKQATAIRKLSARHRIAMTGTPIENRLTELWSIFDFINPGYLGSQRAFAHRFSGPPDRAGEASRIAQLRRLVRPFLLRRVKSDPKIELDLPDKLESKTYVSLTPEQASLYETYIADLFERLEKLPPLERRGLILASLTKLKQICNHPAAFRKETGPQRLEGRSHKLERLLEMVRELRQEGDRCLVFTQFVETGRLLEQALRDGLDEPVLFLHGRVPKSQRDRMIDLFQHGYPAKVLPAEQLPEGTGYSPAGAGNVPASEHGIFLLSLRAGGIGLNLTAANHVFHFDRWWNPAVENQATDRAFRIGQTKHVHVHKFVTLGTLEERIDEMIERKQGLSQEIVGTGEQWITELSTEELRDLFALRREWSTE